MPKQSGQKDNHKAPQVHQVKNKKKVNPIRVLIVVAGVFLVLGIAFYAAYHMILDYYLGKLNIVTKETGLIYATAPITDSQESTQTEEVITFEDHHGEMGEKNLPLICNTKDVTNILLMATDARGNEAGLSDTMILLSINEKTQRIVLCSFMRDIYALYPQEPQSPVSGRYDKLTHAHAYGGPELTMAVLKENYNVQVDHYVKVNFKSFVTIVDAMGGLDMYLTAEEAWWINEFIYAQEIWEIFPTHHRERLPEKEGTYRLTGLQCLGHARNRRIGSDWARTQRQRNLIGQMMVQARELSLSQLDSLLDQTLPLITTNIPKDRLKELVGNAFSYLKYEVDSTRFPLNGTYHEVNYNIVPDVEVNCGDLYERIYSEKPKTEN